MKNGNILIALIFIFLIILNVDGVLPSPSPKVIVDPAIAVVGEGMVAMAINNMKFELDAVIPIEPCKCNGTGYVMSGDGIQRIKCQCGDNCTCRRQDNGMIPPVRVEPLSNCAKPAISGYTQGPVINIQVPAVEKPEIKILPLQIIQFTASWCPPCHAFNEDVKGGKELEVKNWYKHGLVKRVDVDEYPELFEKYKQNDAIPQFVVIKDGKVIDYMVGRPMTDSKSTAANKISSLYMKYYEQR